MAEFRLDRFKFNWKGTWGSSITYTKDDIVYYQGKSYVCLLGHTSTADFYNEFNNDYTIDVQVSVGVDNFNSAGSGVFYFNGVERPDFDMIRGNTYKFIQADASNFSYNQNNLVQPLGISTLENGTLQGGTFNPNVRYYIDEVETTRELYYVNFATANVRYITYTPDANSPKNLFYFSTVSTDMGRKLVTRYSSYWEQMSDGQLWSKNWTTQTKYSVGQFVKYNGYIYKCIEDHTSTSLQVNGLIADIAYWEIFYKGSNWLDEWTVATDYRIGDVVRYGGKVYQANTQHTSNSTVANGLEIDQSYWTFVSESFDWTGDWAPTTRYKLGDVVKYGGIVYICTTAHTSALSVSEGLEEDQGNWAIKSVGIEWKGDHSASGRYKVGDVVKYGGTLFKAITGHTANGVLRVDESNWEVYVPGLQEEQVWNNAVEYNIGDVVLYGGYSYVALTNNANSIPSANGLVQNTGDWEILTRGYKLVGDYDVNEVYKTGEVVRVGGYLYTALTDATGIHPDSDTNTWKVVAEGFNFENRWTNAVAEYDIGDIVTWKSTSYVCVTRHAPTSLNRPDQGTAEWTVFIQGDPDAVLTFPGDLIVGNSSNAKDRLALGAPGQALKQIGGDPAWGTFDLVTNVFYVSPQGVDSPNNGSQQAAPFRTIKYALEHIASNIDTDNVNTTLLVKTGFYQEVLPMKVPRNCAVVGDELRSTNIQPAAGYETSDMFYMNNGSGLRNCTLQGLSGTLGDVNQYLTKRPTAGAYVSLDPGSGPSDATVHIINKSPYVQNVTTFGTGCIGMKIDGALHNGGNDSIVANDFTQVLDDGIGYWATNGGRSELVSVFTYFCHIGYLAENGGVLRATNGNNSYGTYGSVAEGVDANETAITGQINNESFEAGVEEFFVDTANQSAIWAFGYDNAGRNYSTASVSIAGSGANATAEYNEFRQGAIDKIRVTAPGDSTTPGGINYTKVVNNAQTGDTGSITIAQADVGSAAEYIGQRIVILSGKGAGQYAQITGFDEITKKVLVSRETDLSNGWEHISPGYPIVSTLDETTRYQIEPRPSFANPAPTTTETAGNPNQGAVTEIYKYVAKNDTNVVRVGTDGQGTTRIQYSAITSNGTVWNTVSHTYSGNAVGVVWSGTRFVIFYENDANISTSVNGTTFATEAMTSGAIAGIQSVASNGDGAVVITKTVAGGTSLHWSGNEGTTFASPYLMQDRESAKVVWEGTQFWVFAGGVSPGPGLGQATSVRIFSVLPLTGTILVGNHIVNDWESTRSIAVGQNQIVFLYENTSGDVKLARYTLPGQGTTYWPSIVVDNQYQYAVYGAGNFIFYGGYGTDILAHSKGGDHLLTFGDDSSVFAMPSSNKYYCEGIYIGSAFYIPSDDVDHTLVDVYTKPLIRTKVTNSRIEKFVIYDPGSGYLGSPGMTVVDNTATITANFDISVQDGVLPQPKFIDRGLGYVSVIPTITGDGFTNRFQTGSQVVLKNVSDVPGPGANFEITGIDDVQYSITRVDSQSGSAPNFDLTVTITPKIDVDESPDHNTQFVIRENYSQIRLTGHDFLDIGTGSVSTTRYPDLYLEGEDALNARQPFNETHAEGGGRVFYTSTDQDGNFRVGELFEVEQSTGIVSINADQFDLTGLEELALGGIIVGGSQVVIREFSKDDTFVANSNNIVPTQRAIKSYLENRISGGGANALTNRLVAGQVEITSNTIGTTSGLQINVPPVVDIRGGIDGHYLAVQFYTSTG